MLLRGDRGISADEPSIVTAAAVKAYGKGLLSVNETSDDPNNNAADAHQEPRSGRDLSPTNDFRQRARVLSLYCPIIQKSLGNDGEKSWLIHYKRPFPRVKVSSDQCSVAWNNAVRRLPEFGNSGDEDAQRARNAVIAGGLAGGAR